MTPVAPKPPGGSSAGASPRASTVAPGVAAGKATGAAKALDGTRPLARAGTRSARPRVGTALGAPSEPVAPRGLRGWLSGAIHDNRGLKLVSLILASTVFLLVKTQEDREVSVTVRVAYTPLDDKVLVSPRVDEVRVTLKGPWRRIKQFDEREPIEVDLRGMDSGVYPLRADMVRLPSGLAVTAITPSTIRVDFEPMATKNVPVTVSTAGHPLHGYRLVEARATPAIVAVRGAESTIAALGTVRTREVRVDDRNASFETTAELVVPAAHVQLMPGESVSVAVEIDAEAVAESVGPLVVQARAAEGEDPGLAHRLALSPREVTVVLRGSRLAVEALLARGVVPIVRVYAEDLGGKGRRKAVEILDAPAGVGIEVTPRQVTVTALRR